LIENLDYLRSEKYKLRKKLEALERNFEAKSKVYSEHSEEGKLLREKKNFQIKHDVILAEISSIDETISKIETRNKMEEDIRHKREWKEIQSELLGYPDKTFRTFFKQFGQACLKLKKPILSLSEIYQEIDLANDEMLKVLQHIKNNHENFRTVCGIREDFDNHFSTRFAKELSQI